MPLVLASSSPSRRQILKTTRLEFTAVSPDIDESPLPGESARNLVERLSMMKAEKLATQFPHALIIGSDQVADLRGNIMGKPRSHNDAVSQLRRSSGSTLKLYTGIALLNSSTGSLQSGVDTFEVEFRDLSAIQIENYLAKAKPYDSCGSLQAEGIGIALLRRLSGNDPNTLIGLPLIKLISFLENEGIYLIETGSHI